MKKFRLEKAKSPINKGGLDVVTRNGEKVTITKIIKSSMDNQNVIYPIVGLINGIPYSFMRDGKFTESEGNNYDLFLNEE